MSQYIIIDVSELFAGKAVGKASVKLPQPHFTLDLPTWYDLPRTIGTYLVRPTWYDLRGTIGTYLVHVYL